MCMCVMITPELHVRSRHGVASLRLNPIQSMPVQREFIFILTKALILNLLNKEYLSEIKASLALPTHDQKELVKQLRSKKVFVCFRRR